MSNFENNQYLEILKQNNIDISEQCIFPLFRKSKEHGTIVKFINHNSGSIVRESIIRDSIKDRNLTGTLNKLGYYSDNWCKYDNTDCWIDLDHKESMQFDENYSKEIIDALFSLTDLEPKNEIKRASSILDFLI